MGKTETEREVPKHNVRNKRGIGSEMNKRLNKYYDNFTPIN